MALGWYASLDLADLRRQSFGPQRVDDELPFEGAVGSIRHMLQGAAAAGAVDAIGTEMPAGRLLPVGGSRGDRHHGALVLDAGDRYRLAGQREGHIDWPILAIGNAVALCTEPVDGDCFRAHAFVPASRNS